MPDRRSRFLPHVLFVVVLWLGVLPGVLIADSGNGIVFRGPGPLAAGVAAIVLGIGIIVAGARHLAGEGVSLFGVRPGAILVTDGPYSVVRNPIEIGSTVLAFASWLALDVPLMWVVPVAALVSYVVGSGPYEDRLLLEQFGDDFREYRRTVAKWVPIRW